MNFCTLSNKKEMWQRLKERQPYLARSIEKTIAGFAGDYRVIDVRKLELIEEVQEVPNIWADYGMKLK